MNENDNIDTPNVPENGLDAEKVTAESNLPDSDAIEVAMEIPCPDHIPSEVGEADGQSECENNDCIELGREFLESRIASLEDQLASQSRRAREREEFCRIFPEADPDDLPDQVVNDVESGIPLAAAYALYCRIRENELALARSDSQRNLRSAPPAMIGSEENNFFSADEVRSMSGSQVRKNFHAIMDSMKHWH